MALLKIGSVRFDADLVALDKDGTLIDFDLMWGRLAEAWVQYLTRDTGEKALERELYRSFGYDPQQGRTAPQSSLAIATTGQLQPIAASALYRHRVLWQEAEDRTRSVFRQVRAELPLRDLIRPAGNVAGLLECLQAAGVRVSVITTDDQAETAETLRIMEVAHLVDLLVCGDDGWPLKPAPDMLLTACSRLAVEPARTLVVGDTVADLQMAQRAGAGLKVAVLTGVGEPSLLRIHADVIISSIDGITIEQCT